MDDRIRDELLALQTEFRVRGVYRPATARIVLEWAYNLTLTSAFVGWWLFEPWWLKAASLVVSAVGLTGITTSAHTAAHGTAVPWRRVNAFLTYLGYPFMVMMSAHYWRYKHNAVHHPHPNVVGIDADCDLMPFFAMNETEIRSAHPVLRVYYRHLQGWVFPVAVTLNGFNVHRASWAYLIRQMLDPRTRQPAHWLDLGTLFLHVVVWIVLPCWFSSIGEGLVLYLLRIGFVGHAMFFVFAPAHFPAEADFVERSAARRHFVMRQTQGTLNYRTGFIGSLACNGVQYQIEHHLFPNICHVHYAKVAPLVREFCERNGYPYRTLRWRHGIMKSYLALFRPRPIRRMAAPHEPLPAPAIEAEL